MAAQGWDFLVLRSDLHQTKIAPVTLAEPADGEVLFRVESFSLTANNVTYAVAGDQIGYWRFFPKPDGWGCIPAWGYGVVESSANPDFKAGERFYGYWPMASHLLASPRRSRAGFVDEAACRADLPPTYNQYVEAPADAPHQGHRSLLNPLFMTSFLIDDLLVDNGDFGAKTVILASASSRTSMGLAWLLKQSGRVKVLGLTSPRNRPSSRTSATTTRLSCTTTCRPRRSRRRPCWSTSPAIRPCARRSTIALETTWPTAASSASPTGRRVARRPLCPAPRRRSSLPPTGW